MELYYKLTKQPFEEVFKISVLKNFAIFIEKTTVLESHFNKVGDI